MDVSNTMTMDINENTDLGTPEYAQASTAKRDAAVKVVSAVPKDVNRHVQSGYYCKAFPI